MDNISQNCQTPLTGEFCSNCGQRTYRRIDRKYILDELQETILHTNKRFLRTLRKLILNPGKTARNFIDGQRVRHYKPLLLVFILSGINVFVSYKLLNSGEMLEGFYSR